MPSLTVSILALTSCQFKILSKTELPAGVDGGTSFTSVCINTAIYLPWLVSQCLKNGVIFRRGIVEHVSEAAHLHHTGQRADIVLNCTGLSSLKLGGVNDTNLYPARGQIVLVRNDPGTMVTVSGTDDGADEACYVMHRYVGSLLLWKRSADISTELRVVVASWEGAYKRTTGTVSLTQAWLSEL